VNDAVDIDTTNASLQDCVQRILDSKPLPSCPCIQRGNDSWQGEYAMFIGRWQPWHAGHRWLIDQALNAGKKLLICVRDVPVREKNPFNARQVCGEISRVLEDFMQEGRVKIMVIPDIEPVNFGRGVGYSVIEHFPPLEISSISATQIRQALAAKEPS
jgi:cytidyltransferase-like protein